MFVSFDALHNYEHMTMTMQILIYLRHSFYYEENERNYDMDMGCLKKYPFVKELQRIYFHSNYSTYNNDSCVE